MQQTYTALPCSNEYTQRRLEMCKKTRCCTSNIMHMHIAGLFIYMKMKCVRQPISNHCAWCMYSHFIAFNGLPILDTWLFNTTQMQICKTIRFRNVNTWMQLWRVEPFVNYKFIYKFDAMMRENYFKRSLFPSFKVFKLQRTESFWMTW